MTFGYPYITGYCLGVDQNSARPAPTYLGDSAMLRGPHEKRDLQLVEDVIFAGRGLALERFSHKETLRGPTPDFRVVRDNEVVAYCEVKSPRDDWLDEQLDQAQRGDIVGGMRSDPAPNKIARHIENAAIQFNAVNSQRSIPNILVFVNHARASQSYGDLVETVKGRRMKDGSYFVTLPHISEDRIGKAKQQIDLYAWVDLRTKRVQGYLCNEANPALLKAVCDLLDIDISKIKR